MAEVMSRVNTPSRLFGGLVLVGTAFLAADLASAGLERSLLAAPRPFETPAVAPVAAPVQARSAEGLQVVLRQPAPEVPTTGPGATTVGPDGEPVEQPAATVVAPNMTLTGTLVAGGASAAILEVGGKTIVAGLGEEVSGFRIARVESTWVGLKRGDQTVELVLETMKGAQGPNASAPPRMADAAMVPQPPAPLPAPASASVDSGEALSLDDIRAQLDNASKMAQQVRVVPKERDGQTYGVQLEFRQPDNLMARLGLQHGDVLLAVNGNPIKGAEDLYKAYMTMRNADALEFQVERGGQVTPIQYQLAR